MHLSGASIERLFGAGYQVQVHRALRQPGQYASEETVELVGPGGRIQHVRIVGPPRAEDQVEISRSDEILLGIEAPLRESGDLQNTPGIRIEGPAGAVTLTHGVIRALRHLHCSTADAAALGIADQDIVGIIIRNPERSLTFGDVRVRVSPDYRLELHLDTDEGNAAGVRHGDFGVLAEPGAL